MGDALGHGAGAGARARSVPAGTTLNLNVPHLPVTAIRGVRWARVGGAGLITSARGAPDWPSPHAEELEGPAASEAGRSEMRGEAEEKGEIVLTVGSSVPHGAPADGPPSDEDAVLVAQGYAALSALHGPRADDDPDPWRSSTDGWDRAPAGFTFAP